MDHEISFPIDIAINAISDTEFMTDVVELRSKVEERNSVWSGPRHSFDISTGFQEDHFVDIVLDFFKGLRGRKDTFRFKDFTDFKSCFLRYDRTHLDQEIGTGDGTTTQFQLIKTYGAELVPYIRKIVKPVPDTVEMGLDGILCSAFTVDTTTGIVTFQVAPANGAVITAGYEFDVRVRFADDKLGVTMAAQDIGGTPQINLVEVF